MINSRFPTPILLKSTILYVCFLSVCAHACVCILVYLCVLYDVYMCVCVCAYMCIFMCVCAYVSVCVCSHACAHVCQNMYVGVICFQSFTGNFENKLNLSLLLGFCGKFSHGVVSNFLS